MVVCDEGQPQKTPPRKKPNRNSWLKSGPAAKEGWTRPVNALYVEDISEPISSAWAMAQPKLLNKDHLGQTPKMRSDKGKTNGTNPPMGAAVNAQESRA